MKKSNKKEFAALIFRLKQKITEKIRISNKYPDRSAVNDFIKPDFEKYLQLDKEYFTIIDKLDNLNYFDYIKRELTKTRDKHFWSILFNIYENILCDYETNNNNNNMDIDFLLPILIRKIKDYDFTFLMLQMLRGYTKHYEQYKTYIDKVRKYYNKDVLIGLILMQINLAKVKANYDLEYNFFVEYLDIRSLLIRDSKSADDRNYLINRSGRVLVKKEYSNLLNYCMQNETDRRIKKFLKDIIGKLN